jgi:predicted RNA-binding protein with PIN domain
MPVRVQIAYAQEAQARARAPFRRAPPPKLPVAFRRAASTPDEHRAETAAREEAAAALSICESKNFALSSLYRTLDGRAAAPPVLLVDGYNVLHKWERAAPAMAAGELGVARELLTEALASYSAANGVRVVVAYDAMGSDRRATVEELRSTGVTVAACGDQEADSFIEAQVALWLARGHASVVVATSDQAHATVVRDKAVGPGQSVRVVPASGLLKDIAATEKRTAERVAEAALAAGARIYGVREAVRGRGTLDALRALRDELPPPPAPWRRRRGGGGSGSSSSGSESDGGGGGSGS